MPPDQRVCAMVCAMEGCALPAIRKFCADPSCVLARRRESRRKSSQARRDRVGSRPARLHGPPRPCEKCGTFLTSMDPTSRLCSQACRISVKNRRLTAEQRAARVAAAMTRRRSFTCERCGVSFVGTPGVSKTRFCSDACRFPKPEPAVLTVVPWASCLCCRSWFVARLNRMKCSTCTPRRIMRTLSPPPCADCGDAVAQPPGKGRRLRCDECRQARTRAQRQAAKRPRPPEKRKQYRKQHKQRRRALKRGVLSEPYTLAEIAERDRWRCHICRGAVPKRLLGRDGYHPKGPSIDHLVPLALGGDDVRGNVALAHHRCNTLKGATLPAGGAQLALPLAS